MNDKESRNPESQPLVLCRLRDTTVWRTLAGVGAAIPFVGWACVCGATWITPLRWGSETTHYILALMMAEFFVMHSSAFLAAVTASGLPRARKLLGIGGLGAVYLLAAGGYSLAVRSPVPIVSMVSLLVSRFVFVGFMGQMEQRELKHQLTLWGVSGTAYLLIGIITSAVPGLPRMGMTPEIVASLHLGGRGLWFNEPHRVAAFGFFYFLIMALAELVYGPLEAVLGRRGANDAQKDPRAS